MIVVIVKSILITIAIHAIIRILRHASASTRHLVVAAGFAALVMLPAASALLPRITLQVPLLQERERSAEASAAAGAIFARLPPLDRTAAPVPGQYTAPHGDRSFRVSGAQLLAMIWIGGILISVAPLILGLCHSAGMRRRGTPWTIPDTCASVLPLVPGRSHVEVRVNQDVTTPMTCGVFRPVVILPSDVDSWSSHDVRRALAHEFEHVWRRDWLTLCLTRAVCAVYWFNPLVWTAWSRLRLEAERACDDAVLRDEEPIDYADQLVMLAQRRVPRSLLVTMASPDDLSVRIGAMLDSTQPRRVVSVRRGTAILVTTLCAVTAIAVVRAQPAVRVQAAAPELMPLQTVGDTQARSENWQRRRTGHFVIHYRQGVAVNLDAMAVAAETAYRELQRDLGWDAAAPIPIVLVRDQSEASLQGAAPGSELQGNRVLVPVNLAPAAVAPFFRHELTHLFAFERLWTPSAGRPHWLFEGLARYEEGVWSESDHEQLQTVIRNGPLPAMTDEFKRALPLMARAAAPGVGHAMFEFIETRFGRERVRDFVIAWSEQVLNHGGNPFDEVLPVAAVVFNREFEDFLRQR